MYLATLENRDPLNKVQIEGSEFPAVLAMS